MLEDIWLAAEKKKKLWHIFFFALFFTIISIFMTTYLLPFSEGLVSVFMVSLAAAYPTIRYLKREEQLEVSKRYTEKRLLKRHWRELEVYLALFLGTLVGFTIAELLVRPEFFLIQKEVIRRINPSVPLRGLSTHFTTYWVIVTNNLWVFSITFLVSFFISAGGIFVLVWNSSILGVFLANAARSALDIPIKALQYLPHGTMEIAAYVIAGIAGSLFSKQFSLYFFRKASSDEVFSRIWKDVLVMVSIGVGLIFLAGVIEVM